MCDGLYLGARAGQPRPNPFWTNPAIKPIADQIDDTPGEADHLDPNKTQNIRVTVGNSQDYQLEGHVELYWSDPTTGFLADPAKQIEPLATVIVPGRTLAGDGSTPYNYVWQPSVTDPTAATTNGGHVCLLARVSHNSQAKPGGECGGHMYDASAPTTDYCTAIHNIMLVAGGAGSSSKALKFAFAATNPLGQGVGTKLTVRPLLPEKHVDALERVLTPSRNYRFAAFGNQFGTPNSVGVALGRERMIARPIRQFATTAKSAGALRVASRQPLFHVPNLGYSGVLDDDLEESLRGKYRHDETQTVDLLAYEIRQAIVTLVPSPKADLYAFEVVHETTEAHPRVLGGITFIYRTRRRLF